MLMNADYKKMIYLPNPKIMMAMGMEMKPIQMNRANALEKMSMGMAVL